MTDFSTREKLIGKEQVETRLKDLFGNTGYQYVDKQYKVVKSDNKYLSFDRFFYPDIPRTQCMQRGLCAI